MSDLRVSKEDLDYLVSPRAVRERAGKIFSLAEKGGTHFAIRSEKLEKVADFVLEVTRESYPDAQIPFHSRWEHFRAGGVDRVSQLDRLLAPLSPMERARAKIDLAIASVLLDAGAGVEWKYKESGGQNYGRSEGLAVASYHLFVAGKLSSDPKHPLRADVAGLKKVDASLITSTFQVSQSNPLVGLEGRAGLLNKLGQACQKNAMYFPGEVIRPGNLIDFWAEGASNKTIRATEILKSLLFGLSEIWPARTTLNGIGFGDVWSHSGLGRTGEFSALMPFHKLSQWLAYSLIEPAEEAGFRVEGVHELTGLPEYRNGGLLIDMGVLELRDPADISRTHSPASELVIEWRALTVICLDRIGEIVRKKLGKTEQELPLAKVLQGGTWTAGRKVASQKRGDGSPPLKLDLDGTVF